MLVFWALGAAWRPGGGHWSTGRISRAETASRPPGSVGLTNPRGARAHGRVSRGWRASSNRKTEQGRRRAGSAPLGTAQPTRCLRVHGTSATCADIWLSDVQRWRIKSGPAAVTGCALCVVYLSLAGQATARLQRAGSRLPHHALSLAGEGASPYGLMMYCFEVFQARSFSETGFVRGPSQERRSELAHSLDRVAVSERSVGRRCRLF